MTDFPPVRYGILGAANIARQFTKGLAGSAVARVDAVASRGAEKAGAFAAELGIPRSHASYEALLADPEIDAIYIPLPNTMHAEWAIRSAEACKHVLCEKPLATTAKDARAMFDAARSHGVHLAEAYPYMSQPQTLRVRALLADGTIGRVQLVSATFGFGIVAPDGAPLGDPANIRLVPEAGGGALLDAGTYAMSFLRIALGAAPVRVRAIARMTTTGVDQTVAATLDYADGALAQLTTSMSISLYRHATILGEKGVIETNYSNHAPAWGGGLSLRIKRGVPGTIPFETEEMAAGDGFLAEGESFARMLRQGASHWNGASESESVDTVRALEAIAASARGGGDWVAL